MNILWSSNAPWSTSGYGQQTALTVPRIQKLGHNIAINCFFGLEGAAINWNGITCYPTDRTRFGNEMLGDYAAHLAGGDRGDCHVITLMDCWVMLQAVDHLADLNFTCWTPVDHDPVPPMVAEFLQRVNARVLAMTRFGQARLNDHGFDALYVPHAIDTSTFRPNPEVRQQQRQRLNIPDDKFVVGMVAANQGLPPRKAFPQVFEAFAEFQRRHPNSLLYLHTDIRGRLGGVDLEALGKATGVDPSAMMGTDYTPLHIGLPASTVAAVYALMDVLAMPSLGEGFGIPLIEAQATGCPVITTDWTATAELCGAGWLVDGDRFYDGTQRSFYKVPSIAEILDALEYAYEARDDQALKDKARQFALGYDVDKVFEECWVPILDEMAQPREVAPLRIAA